MSRPKRLRLGAHTIPVSWHDGFVGKDCEAAEDGHWGVCHLGKGGLAIAVSLEHFDPPANLLHEAIHAVLETGGARRVFGCIEDEEVVIEAVSHGVVELLRRNPALVTYLVEGEH